MRFDVTLGNTYYIKIDDLDTSCCTLIVVLIVTVLMLAISGLSREKNSLALHSHILSNLRSCSINTIGCNV